LLGGRSFTVSRSAVMRLAMRLSIAASRVFTAVKWRGDGV
jgi:hypothetical protein